MLHISILPPPGDRHQSDLPSRNCSRPCARPRCQSPVRDHSQREMNCSPPQLKRAHEIAYPYAESLGNPPQRRKAQKGLVFAIANLNKGLICLLEHLFRTTCAVSRRLIPRIEVIPEIFSQFFERFVLVPASCGQEPIYDDPFEHKARLFMNPRQDLILTHTQTLGERL